MFSLITGEGYALKSSDDLSPDGDPEPNPKSHARTARIALFIATFCGLGYIPVVPQFFGALVGLALALSVYQMLVAVRMSGIEVAYLGGIAVDPLLVFQCLVAVAVAAAGVWGADRVSHDGPQKTYRERVAIDKVSGQHLALVLGSALPVWWRTTDSWAPPLGFITYQSVLGGKYLLLGLLLFLAFDLGKPFPVRQAASLPGGWGIMTDDWVAGVYAALGLWLARAFGW
jgi:phosphatidylglycerophosphatase A